MHLFVYGTLRASDAHPMHERLRAQARYEGAARVRGRLYRIAHYPGLVIDDRAGWVNGELYRLLTPEIFDTLDRYEGFDPDAPDAGEYQRIQHVVQRIDGDECLAWLYEYRWSIADRAPITSGDFLKGEP